MKTHTTRLRDISTVTWAFTFRIFSSLEPHVTMSQETEGANFFTRGYEFVWILIKIYDLYYGM